MLDQAAMTRVLQAANSVFQSNAQALSQHARQVFFQQHQANGQYVANLANYIMQAARNQQLHDQALFAAVTEYIRQWYSSVYTPMLQQHQARQMAAPFGQQPGGFGQPASGFGPSPFAQAPTAGGWATSAPPVMPGTMIDDSIQPRQQPQTPIQPTQPQPQTTTPQSVVAPAVVGASMPTNDTIAVNPIEALDDIPRFDVVRESPNWIGETPHDRSIVIQSRSTMKSNDGRHYINHLIGVNRQFFNNVTDVARDFFRVAPPMLFADNYVFEMFYNHIDVVDIPTAEFDAVRVKFVKGIMDNPDQDIYKLIFGIINNLVYSPRMAIDKYLTDAINRQFDRSLRTSERPNLSLQFGEINDLQELLGPSFEHPFLHMPNGRQVIRGMVANAITNAMTASSKIMFTDIDPIEVRAIKNSPVFPFALTGVYPDKSLIPDCGGDDDTDILKFFELLQEQELSQRTYIRSVRKATFTNLLGNKTLPQIGKAVTKINGFGPRVLQCTVMNPLASLSAVPVVSTIDSREPTNVSYAEYAEDPAAFENRDINSMVDVDLGPIRLPTDSVLFATQYKRSHNEYLAAFNVFSTRDHPSDDKDSLFLARRDLTGTRFR